MVAHSYYLKHLGISQDWGDCEVQVSLDYGVWPCLRKLLDGDTAQ